MILSSIEFFNNTAKVDAAYEDAINVFAETKPYAITKRFVPEYIIQTKVINDISTTGYLLFDGIAWRELTDAEKASSWSDYRQGYVYKIEGFAFTGGSYQSVVVFNSDTIDKINEALEDNLIAYMSHEEENLFSNYLDYLSRRVNSTGVGRVDISAADTKEVLSGALDEWLNNILEGLPERNPVALTAEVI